MAIVIKKIKSSKSKNLLFNTKKTNPAFFKSFYSSPVAKALLHIKTGKYVEVNNYFLKLFECTRKQVIGRSPDELGLWADLKERKKILPKYKRKRSNTFNINVKTLKGKIKNIIVTTETLEINGENFLLGHLIDNTNKNEFEKTLLESEEQYRLLFYSNPLPMWVFDNHTHSFIAVNKAALNKYGYSNKEFLKLKPTDIRPKREIKRFLEYTKKLETGNNTYKVRKSGIWIHKKKNGDLINVEITRSSIKYKGKKAILIIANDVTEQLRIQSSHQKKNKEVVLLYDVHKELTSSLEPEVIYRKVYNALKKIMPCDAISVMMENSVKTELRFVSLIQNGKKHDVSALPVTKINAEGKGILMSLLRSGESRIINDYVTAISNNSKVAVDLDGKIIKELTKKQIEKDALTRSAMFVPIKLEDKIIGLITVYSYRKDAYCEENMRILEALSIQLSTATVNAHLFQQAQNEIKEREKAEVSLKKKTDEITLLYEAEKELISSLGANETYDRIYKIVSSIIPCDNMLISSYDRSSKTIKCLAAWIQSTKLDNTIFPELPLDRSGKGHQSNVILSGKSVIIENFDAFVKKNKRTTYFYQDNSSKKKLSKGNKVNRSGLLLPMILNGKVIGVIQVLSYEKGVYKEEHMHLLEALTAQISAATANALLYQQTQTEIKVRKETETILLKTSKEISDIYEITKDFSSALSTEEINRKIFKIINSTFPECDIGISLLDKDRKNIYLKGLYTNGKEIVTDSYPPIKFDETGKGLQSGVILSKRSKIISNYKDYVLKKGAKYYIKDDGTVAYKKDNTFSIAESAVIIPLIYENNVIGTLQLLNYSNNSYSYNTLKMIETLASHIAVSYVNAQLYQKAQNELEEKQQAEKALQAKTEELQILYEAQMVLSGSLDIDSIYDNIYRIISSKIPCDSMIISSYNKNDDLIKILSIWADGVKPGIKDFPPIPLAPKGHGIQSEVIRTGESLLIMDYPEFYNKTITRYSYINDKVGGKSKVMYNSGLIVPMKHEGKVIGVLQLFSYAKNAYNSNNLKLLESLTSPITAATFNASLYKQAKIEIADKQKAREELALRNREITLLYNAGRELLSTLDLEEIYETLYRKVKEVIQCDSMIIAEYIKNSNKIICKSAWVEETKHVASDFPPINIGSDYKGTQSEAIVTGNSVIVNNFDEVIKNRTDKYYIDKEGNLLNYEASKEQIDDNAPVVRSAIFIPLKLGKNVIGVLSVFSYKENAYSEYDLKILESISVHLSVAAANAELYKRAQNEISERSKKEEELKRISNNLEEAQRIAHIGSWMYDLRVEKIYNSNELYRILGIEEDPNGFKFDEAMSHIHPEDRDGTISKFKEAISQKRSYENEDRIIRPNGEIRNVKIVGEPIYDEKGIYIGIQGTLQDITDIKKINDELINSLSEKELMLKEIHHRVKNNLQVVSSLLRLQSENITDEAAIGYLKMSEQRVKSMALIHQQLYRTKDLSHIDFKEYLEDLCNYLFFAYDMSFSRVELKIDVDNIYFGIDTALPCGLIINELVTNSIKHAFPEYNIGTLYLGLRREVTGKYILTVKDDGKGAGEIDFKNTSTLGMELVKTLTEQLEGEIKVNSDNGTEIIISFYDQTIRK